MQSEQFIDKAKEAIIIYVDEKYGDKLEKDDLHLVWFAKELQNFKCTMVDLLKNQRYYECTYNGDKDEFYLDIYQKEYNFKIN